MSIRATQYKDGYFIKYVIDLDQLILTFGMRTGIPKRNLKKILKFVLYNIGAVDLVMYDEYIMKSDNKKLKEFWRECVEKYS